MFHSSEIMKSDDESVDDIFNLDEEEESRIDDVAHNETVAVNRIKLAVFAVLVCSALGAAISVFLYLSNGEDKLFRNEFADDSNKVLQAIGGTLDKTLGSLDGVAVALISHARSAGERWPFVTLPDFALRMSKVLPLSEITIINFLPLVTPEQRKSWEAYSVENDYWVDESMALQAQWNGFHGPVVYGGEPNSVLQGDFGEIPRNTSRVMLPIWQNFPVLANTTYTYNFDWLSITAPEPLNFCLDSHKAVMSVPYMIPTPGNIEAELETEAWAEFFRDFIPEHENPLEPMSDLFYPVIDETSRINTRGVKGYNPANHTIVGMLAAQFYWRSFLRKILPEDSNGIHVVFSNPCSESESFTYKIMGPNVAYVGVGDLHERKYDDMGEHMKLHELGGHTDLDSAFSGSKLHGDFCELTVNVYPSDEMRDRFTSYDPILFTLAVLFIFAFTSGVFSLYDSKVERRQQTVLKTAVQSSAIVSSLFPAEVRDRLYPSEVEMSPKRQSRAMMSSFAHGISSHLDEEPKTRMESANAQLYPETTVMFADIAGFTAWSSERQPNQVFYLLEMVYGAFDAIAKQRGVFKVETIGDCYVAVVGLPTPKRHHATIMARFANDCRNKMISLAADLETTLGPGTADLALRIGLNSGPTTAGVLRGEKARFQLFGDTVNTAARMESNGQRNKIQVSQKTADLIKLAGKEHWLTPRDTVIDCKGKGKMVSFWCEPRGAASASISDPSSSEVDHSECNVGETDNDNGYTRLIDWNVDLFLGLLRDVVASRGPDGMPHESYSCSMGLPANEVKEVIDWTSSSRSTVVSDTATISITVATQLRTLITVISDMYRSNPFHDFDHSAHVVMSTKKLLDRIESQGQATSSRGGSMGGVSFDPLSRLAIVFAALIHDVDHRGVSNAQLVQEDNSLAQTYKGKSVAEQNSVDMAWNVLMEPWFAELRCCMFASEGDVTQFRQVVVNAVMATDLFDPDMKALRTARWDRSFQGPELPTDTLHDLNRRLTIVLELIIQASDVSHTMQHFTVYQKWNRRLLTEMYTAYQCGRTATDPTETWYQGELWFFDNYVIPLAQKLRQCGVFGVSCDEFLDYAKDNRMEWQAKGLDIVEEFKLAWHADPQQPNVQ